MDKVGEAPQPRASQAGRGMDGNHDILVGKGKDSDTLLLRL